ncbi:MAG: carbamoyltransferase N-terminal domain-containing protein [Flammeovirgaceae bacterium]
MIHCGLKFTHDGAIALIRDNKLLFSIEIEKLSNNPRYAEIDDSGLIERILNNEGFSIDDIDHFVVDGWGGTDEDSLAVQPRLRHGTGYNYLSYKNNGTSKEIAVNSYQESKEYPDILAGLTFNDHAGSSNT